MTCHQARDPRRRYYTLLAVGKRDLCWREDEYRAFLRDHGAQEVDGHVSARSMSITDLVRALEDMKHLGFRPKRVRSEMDWRTPRIKKITAMWIALADAGVVRDPGEVAMERWCLSLTHTARLSWADSAALNQCIEGLKSWARRERVELPD